MSGSPPDRPGSRAPRGLLGMLALVAAVELGVAGHRADFATPWAEDWRFAARAAGRRAPGSDVLCFGDSLVKFGVLPRVIEARAGLKAYNLATSGGTMPSAYFLLRRALGSGARPRAIVADFAALMLKDPDPPTLQNYPELASLKDCLDLAWTARDPGFFASSGLSKALPSYHWRFEVRSAITAALDGRSLSQRAALPVYRRNWEAESGAQPMPPGRVRHPSEDFLIDGVSPAAWACEPRNEAYLDRFLALAESRGIAVFWLIPPLCPEVHARRGRRGSDAAYGRFARGKLDRHRNLVILDARASGYDDTVHIDHIHLDRRGAAVLSGDVASALLDRPGPPGVPAGPRWVDLPPYAGRSGDGPARSLARSRPSNPR